MTIQYTTSLNVSTISDIKIRVFFFAEHVFLAQVKNDIISLKDGEDNLVTNITGLKF